MSLRRATAALLSAALAVSVAVVSGGPVSGAAAQEGGGDNSSSLRALHSLRAPVTDENFYFVMADRFENGDTSNDTGGLGSDPLVSGFDPTSKGFYNGGDLSGISERLDYIQGLGTTSIWLTPSFKNQAVSLPDGPSAGYHGYWVTDFTQIDPHLGSNAELKSLIDESHARGMKVYFDIITNHTADVIGYPTGPRAPYISKDTSPYLTAAGQPFDDRDYAGTDTFPALDPATSFPLTPVLDPGEENVKVPAWLNDVTLYHNRGDTTFVGENSYYGDFFGLDDLFTEHPRVVSGMIDIYKTWIRDFGVDGFRIDTMKHVDDEFWQKFGPEVLQYAKSQGKREFFMFGEVFDTSRPFTSTFTTRNQMQSVLDFPFQAAARDFASKGAPAQQLEDLFAADDWYTDADSNAYQLPTFLGNHDMGRIGSFIQSDNPDAGDAEWLARDRLAHELMYFSRGNPVIYYGDEQGFTGSGGDQLARQTLFASQVTDYLDDDLLGTTRTHAVDNFESTHPMYRTIRKLAAVTKAHPALRDGAHQNRYADAEAGVYAFSRIDEKKQREYVVALNNSEQPRTVAVPTWTKNRPYLKIYGESRERVKVSSYQGKLVVTVPALASVVFTSLGPIPRSRTAPSITIDAEPAEAARTRMQVSANVRGSSFYEVTFYAKAGSGAWRPIGTDDNAPYRVFHDVDAIPDGTSVQYKAVVLDNANHRKTSNVSRAVVPPPSLVIEAPAEGSNVPGTVSLLATADPDRATHSVTFERSIAGADWTTIGTDDSSPAYTAVDDLTPLGLAEGVQIQYRATLTEPDGTVVTSPIRTVQSAGPPPTMATLHYLRPAGDYGDPAATGWGLHLWGDAVDPAVLAQVAWDVPWPRTRVVDGWAEYDIPLTNATAAVNFIMHLPAGDSVPTTRETGGDRSFVPLNNKDVWIVQGDPTVYTSKPAL